MASVIRFADAVFRWFVQSWIAIDCFCNVFFLSPLVGSVGMSGESMSAHCYRDTVASRRWALKIMPIIDWMFSWQKPNPLVLDTKGQMIVSHCERAFYKTRMGYYLPPEYRQGPSFY
jgi:hypothetical protein